MKFFMIFLVVCAFVNVSAQDVSKYEVYENTFYKYIEKSIADFNAKPEAEAKKFQVDFTGKKYPKDMSLYTQVWAQPTASQGRTGTCWCYCTTSFYESEIYRLYGKQVKLSEMYTVYWEVVEKARGFVRSKGTSFFSQGSQSGAIKRMWKKYGVVPAEAYIGKKPEQEFHDHDVMYKEMTNYLQSVKRDDAWNENRVIETIRCILDEYMGPVPETVVVDGKTMTPQEYLESLQINLDDYMELFSLHLLPYYQLVEYEVDDNWWHGKEFFNVPLAEFMRVMKSALRNGFSVDLGGDVTEPGYAPFEKVAMIPSFDIPSEYINEHARAFRFTNKTTTDDHGIHCIGYYAEPEGKDWFLIKDSGSGVRNVDPKGYYFMHEDYIKLKMMTILVHKDADPELWEKYQAAKK
ncbi:MAG: peptidase C1 [Planctomycetes bacterium]|nr:peptidase C1 [Planctomycetota bacterium]HPY74368.1 peptidase C1 [Planctomycetota bacterium]HQA99972.1 peptidase C1 [Planctomycetota bacterium]HRU50859.1 peptidase C1 [Planctomycetota bacterium]